MAREIGIVGLGRMGGGIARRLAGAGFRVVGRDPAAARGAGVERVESLRQLTAALAPPRIVWLMLPAGDPTAATLAELGELLDAGDLVVDGGNSHYRDSLRHHEALAARGIDFADVGVSGGLAGEAEGYCLMAGGGAAVVERLRPVLEVLAAAPDRGWARVGAAGAGHFAKMVHNGIEYGLMQSYAEGFAILEARDDLGLEPARIADLWRHGSVIRSWLLDLVAGELAEPGRIAGVAPRVDDSGEGRWAVQEAIDLDVPAPVMTLSLLQRIRSRDEAGFTERLLAALRRRFGGHPLHRDGDD